MVFKKEYRLDMKIAKSYKFILICLAFIMAFSFAIASVCVKANAEETDLSMIIGGENRGIEFVNDKAQVTVVNEDDFLFYSKLVINDMKIELEVPSELSKLVLNLETDSYYVNGNKKVDGEFTTFDKVINNQITIDLENETIAISGSNAVSNFDLVDGRISLTLGVNADSYIVASVNGATAPVATDKYYKIKNIDKAVATISFDCFVTGDQPVNVNLVSVDQKASDLSGDYKQTFKLDADENLETIAKPRVMINDSFYTKTETGYAIIKDFMKTYTMTLTPYALVDSVSASDLYLGADVASGDYWLETGTTTPKMIQFNTLGDAMEFEIKSNEGVYEKYSVKVIDADGEGKTDLAPSYVLDQDAIDAFVYELEKAYKNEEKGTCVYLGSTITLPSFKDLIYDDITPYEDMTKTVYYKTTKTESTSSSLEFTLNDVGNYVFYVAFGDASGNVMDLDKFYVEEDNDKVVYGEWEDLIFSFDFVDDAEISVEEPNTMARPYMGASFTAGKFVIDAQGCTITYKLYYNADENATASSEGWIEIPKASSVSDDKYEKDGYTYDDIKAIAYDGTLTFTPDKMGAYMIVCTATSKVSERQDSANQIFKVDTKTQTVTPHNPWFEENTLSLIFLGIGTLCLFGIIALLFVKPKDRKKDSDK